MHEKLIQKEGEFPAIIKYKGIDYELGEMTGLTSEGTAIYNATVSPFSKGDWPTWIEIDVHGEIVRNSSEK